MPFWAPTWIPTSSWGRQRIRIMKSDGTEGDCINNRLGCAGSEGDRLTEFDTAFHLHLLVGVEIDHLITLVDMAGAEVNCVTESWRPHSPASWR